MTGYGFVGADPAALLGLAETCEQYALRLRAVGGQVDQTLSRDGFPAASAHITGRVFTVEQRLVSAADELRWRAAAMEAAQNVATPALFGRRRLLLDRAEFAALAVFDIGGWEASYLRWRSVPEPAGLRAMSPVEVHGVFAELSPSLATRFAEEHPRLVGALDGAPTALRYLANNHLITARIQDLRHRVAELQDGGGRSWFRWLVPNELIGWYPVTALTDTLAARLGRQADEYQRWLDEGRQILFFDPDGDGRVVEVFGDLTRAARVAVVVPGMGNDLANFSDGDGGFRANARRLYEASMDVGSPTVATVAWLGYDSPDGADATSQRAARAAAPALARFVDGVDPGSERQVTVIAHSYGSVLAGAAARTGLAADNLVFVGSPGTTLDNAGQASLRVDGRVWVALADRDPIGIGVSPDEFPPSWVPLLFVPSWMAIDVADSGAEELWHGSNPAADEFGAVRFDTEGSSGHSHYFDSGSLLNLARIVQGLYGDVDLSDH